MCSDEATWHVGRSMGAEKRSPEFWNRMELTRWFLRASPALSRVMLSGFHKSKLVVYQETNTGKIGRAHV